MSQGSKSLFSLAWPLMISFTARSLLTSIDIPYGSRIGDAAVAAIGLYFPIEFVFIACWVGTSAALTSHLSKAMGERHEARLAQLLGTATRIVVLLSGGFLALAGLLWLFADRLPLEPATAACFRTYAPITMAGVALVGFWSIIPDSLVKAHHDTKTTMIAGLITGLLNLTLNTVFVLGFDWGLVGIAVATGLARVGSLAYALWRARALEAARRAEWAADGAEPKPVGRRPGFTTDGLYSRPYSALLALGVPSALTFVFMSAEGFVVNFLLARSPDSTAAIAAYGIYHRSVLLLLMPVVATGVAVLPFVARLLGEGRLPEVRRSLLGAFRLAFVYVVFVVTPLCALLGPPVAAFLGKEPATEDLARFALRFATPLGALASIPFLLCRPAFEAVQRGGPGLVMAAVRYVGASIPLALLGMTLAPRFQPGPFPAEAAGAHPFVGMLFGLVIGSAVVSVAFLVWMLRMLRGLDPSAPLEPPPARHDVSREEGAVCEVPDGAGEGSAAPAATDS